jgi:hypothetical protein
MSTSAPAPSPALACPDCRVPLTGTATCAGCGLPLRGPQAARLWQVDVDLSRLDAARAALLDERRSLLAALRDLHVAAAARTARREWTPKRVQNALLVLGGVLLAVAAAVFAAVTYDRLGVAGRAGVLLVLTAVAAVAAPRLARRGLGATAETLAAVALALGALDAWGLRRLGVGAELDDLPWLAATAASLAVLSGGYAAAVGLRVARVGAAGLAHVAAGAGVAALEPSAGTASVLLTAVAAADLGALALMERRRGLRDLHAWVTVLAAVTGLTALALALVAGEPGQGALALAGCAALATAAAALAGGRLRLLLAAAPAVLLAVAAVSLGQDELAERWLPVLAGTVALAAAAVAAGLPRAERRGPLAGAWLVAAACCAAVAEPVAAALAGPGLWLTDPWTLVPGTDARAAVAPLAAWTGTGTVPLVLALAAAVAGLTAALLDRRAVPAAVLLATTAALVLPVALDLPFAAALLTLLALAAAALATAAALRARGRVVEALGALLASLAAGVLAAAWSVADQGATLAVLPAVAALLAVAARPSAGAVRQVAAGLAGAAAGAELAAAGAAGGLAGDQVGGLLLVGPAVLLGASVLLPRVRPGLEAAAGTLAVAAVALAAGDPGWLSWVLAGLGLVALAAALPADRRVLAPAGALLLTASSWVRLAQAGVDHPEPYVLPLAALALLLGHLRSRRDSDLGSHAAYGPGLGLLLLPSLLATVVDDGLARPLLLGATALVVVLLGARARLQAPLLLGGATLVAVSLHLLAPYTTAVPRWTSIGAAGTLLLVVGATFEQRRREVSALHERYAALR